MAEGDVFILVAYFGSLTGWISAHPVETFLFGFASALAILFAIGAATAGAQRTLAGFVGAVDALNEWVGRAVSWLTLGTVLFCFAVVVGRYALAAPLQRAGYDVPLVAMQEGYVWLHAIVFMVGAGFTLKHGGHVRVDVFYANMTPRRKAVVDILGTLLFLFPWLFVVASYSWPFIRSAWLIGEGSPQPGGLPAIYLLKSMIYVFCVALGAQGLALLARSVLVLSGREEFSPASSGH